MLHKEIPFLRIIIPLCAGIVSGLYFTPGTAFVVLFSVVIIFSFLYGIKYNRALSNHLFGVSFTLALFLCGMLLYKAEKESLSVLPGGEAVYTGIIDDYPENRENSRSFPFKLTKVSGSGSCKKVKGSVLVYLKKPPVDISLLPGDHLVMKLTPNHIINRGNPYEFDYRLYMENKGIMYLAYADSMDIVAYSPEKHRKPAHLALIAREKIIGMFRERGITGSRLALVSAITLGQKSMLDQEQKSWFMKAGIMHIMAVSGLHAMILSLFIFRLLFFLKGRLNILRVIITLIILWVFAFITGLTPSVLRATLMISFLQAGKMLKRPANGINSVLASALVLILLRPSVIFDAGFLLSYSAVIYILVFYKSFYNRLKFKSKVADFVWQTAAVTIIAQAGTLPLTIHLFNRFPTWFIISNIVIVPVSSLVIIAGALIPLTYPLPFLSAFIAKVLSFLTGLTETLTARAASLPLASIENIGITSIGCILLTVFIFVLTLHLLNRKSVSVIYPLAAALLLTISGTVRVIMIKSSSELVVYNTRDHISVGIREGCRFYLYSDTVIPGQEALKHCSELSLKPELILLGQAPALVKAGDKKILLSTLVNRDIIEQSAPDVLVLTGSYPKVSQVAGNEPRKLNAVIISPVVSSWFRLPERSALAAADTVVYVRKEGAFRLRL